LGEKMDNYQTVAIIPAAGTGCRMNAGTNKIWLKLGGRTILEHILLLFQDCQKISHIILAVNPNEVQQVGSFIRQSHQLNSSRFTLVTGGMNRQDSIGNCLDFLQNWSGWKYQKRIVLIHDAARALVTADLIQLAITQCLLYNAVGVAVPVKDTIKQVDQEGFVLLTPERSVLWAVQTPQVFDFELLSGCYRQVTGLTRKFTDDCSIAEYCGYRVKLIEGSYENIKITTPEDLIQAEAIMKQRISTAK
jgi:2-C-methyl-D-erythritol 4-phosphate cytidylyltransferase